MQRITLRREDFPLAWQLWNHCELNITYAGSLWVTLWASASMIAKLKDQGINFVWEST